METVFSSLPEVGKSISEVGILAICSAAYLLASGSILFFFIRWFVRIINNIINRQQSILDEILQLQREQKVLLEKVVSQ